MHMLRDTGQFTFDKPNHLTQVLMLF